MNVQQLKLYHQLAEWWPLLSDPAEYAEEAKTYVEIIQSQTRINPGSMLELGSGGGNNAYHLKKHFEMTLVDLAEPMLDVSRRLNPECRHIQGDMRSVRLGQTFDTVFINDAIVYMTTADQLQQAIDTAYVHCNPGGVALFVPDWTAENFIPATGHGGHDHGQRGLRYLEWIVDHDPDDRMYTTYMVYLLKENNRVTQTEMDQHICGLFSQDLWLELIEQAGFEAKKLPFAHSDFPAANHFIFVGCKA